MSRTHRIDPKRGGHADSIGIRSLVPAGPSTHQESDVRRTATKLGRRGQSRNGKDFGLDDVLAHIRLTEDGVGVREDVLRDGARFDERAQILRKTWSGVVAGGLRRKWDGGGGSTDDKGGNVHGGNDWWAIECLRGLDRLRVNGRAMRDLSLIHI